MNNLTTVQQAVEFARQSGASDAEAFLHRVRVLTIEVTSAQVENIKQAEDIGIAIRVLADGRIGLSYATDFGAAALQRAALRAVEIARASDADEFFGLAEKPNAPPTLDGFDPEMGARSFDEKIDRAFTIERAAREYDKRIVLTRRITYTEREYVQAIANTRGILAEQRGNVCGGFAMVVARDGNQQEMGGGHSFKRKYAALDLPGIGVEAAENAVMMLGATTVQTQRASILLEPKMTGAFIGIIANLVRADQVQKNKSLLARKIGQRVAAEGVTLIDDGACADAPGMRAWDDEGVPSQKTIVIENGILREYLHNTYTARKAGARSTGNANRMSFKLAPDVAPSNFMLLPGSATTDALRANIARGLWVRNLMNLHTANPISGEFSFGASGLWIENGKIVGPVRGVTISGNLTELLMNIRGVANDLTWQGAMGMSVAAPSVLIEDVSIAGK